MTRTWTLHHFNQVASTMDVARELLPSHPSARFVVQAQQQNQGRGRQQRIWDSPLGNLYATLALPLFDVALAPFFTYITALATHDALSYFADGTVPVTLKWPNDLLLASKKCGGILLEIEASHQDTFLLIGVGVNLVAHPSHTPYPATNLAHHGVTASPNDLLKKLLNTFDHWKTIFENQGFEPLRSAWLNRRDPAHDALTLKGYEHGSATAIQGSFHGLDAQGRLILDCQEGQKRVLKKFSVGDVFFS